MNIGDLVADLRQQLDNTGNHRPTPGHIELKVRVPPSDAVALTNDLDAFLEGANARPIDAAAQRALREIAISDSALEALRAGITWRVEETVLKREQARASRMNWLLAVAGVVLAALFSAFGFVAKNFFEDQIKSEVTTTVDDQVDAALAGDRIPIAVSLALTDAFRQERDFAALDYLIDKTADVDGNESATNADVAHLGSTVLGLADNTEITSRPKFRDALYKTISMLARRNRVAEMDGIATSYAEVIKTEPRMLTRVLEHYAEAALGAASDAQFTERSMRFAAFAEAAFALRDQSAGTTDPAIEFLPQRVRAYELLIAYRRAGTMNSTFVRQAWDNLVTTQLPLAMNLRRTAASPTSTSQQRVHALFQSLRVPDARIFAVVLLFHSTDIEYLGGIDSLGSWRQIEIGRACITALRNEIAKLFDDFSSKDCALLIQQLDTEDDPIPRHVGDYLIQAFGRPLNEVKTRAQQRDRLIDLIEDVVDGTVEDVETSTARVALREEIISSDGFRQFERRHGAAIAFEILNETFEEIREIIDPAGEPLAPLAPPAPPEARWWNQSLPGKHDLITPP